MPKLQLIGSLAANLEELVDVFDGAVGRGLGSTIAFSSGVPYAVSIQGGYFDVPSTGPHFVTGQIVNLDFTEIDVPTMEFTDHLIFENLNVRAEILFDLIEHTATANIGRFDESAFRSYLNAKNWKVIGSSEADHVAGSDRMSLAGDDKIYGRGGADILSGARGADRVAGGSGADKLSGNNGSDDLLGGVGQDVLIGGRGDDDLRGGAGRDRFVFQSGHGDDVVQDFQDGLDVLRFVRVGGVTKQDTADGALLSYDGGTVLLIGVDAADLTFSDGLWS